MSMRSVAIRTDTLEILVEARRLIAQNGWYNRQVSDWVYQREPDYKTDIPQQPRFDRLHELRSKNAQEWRIGQQEPPISEEEYTELRQSERDLMAAYPQSIVTAIHVAVWGSTYCPVHPEDEKASRDAYALVQASLGYAWGDPFPWEHAEGRTKEDVLAALDAAISSLV